MGIALPSIPVDFQTLLYILLVIGGLSGWIALLFDRLSERPKIRGKVLFFMIGTVASPDQPNKQFSGITMFLYLTNYRKNTVHLVDYEVELGSGKHRFRKRFQKLERPQYGISQANFTFLDKQGKKIEIQDFNKMLIYRQNEPVNFGVPLKGYLLVISDLKYYTERSHWVRVTCIDVFGHKHRITSSLDKLPPLDYLGDMFGAKVTPTLTSQVPGA